MGIEVVWVRYGRAAAEALRTAIVTAKADEPLAPVTVVVPSNQIGVATRRLLAAGVLGPTCGTGIGVIGVTFVTPYRLAELLAAPTLAGLGRRPVSTPVIAATVRRVLTEAPGLFGPVAGHPATEAALVASYRELRDLSTGALDALAAASERAGEVVRVHRATRSLLEGEWYDEEDLMGTAAALLRDGPRPEAAFGAVIAYLPQRLSLREVDLIGAVAQAAGVVVIAGTTGDVKADAEVVASVARLAGPSAGPPPSPVPLDGIVAANRTRIVTTSDADEEVRGAMRVIVDAVRDGTPLDRIAVLYATPDPYARLVHEHLEAAGIATNGAAASPLVARTAPRALLRFLALRADNFRRQDVFAWLTAAPILTHGRWAPVTAWERLSRDAGVVAGRADWDKRLERLAAESDEKATHAEADLDAPDWRAESDRHKAQQARSLREFVLHAYDAFDAATAELRSWTDHAAWAQERVKQLLGGEKARASWPTAERAAAEKVERALERLAALHTVEGPVPLDVFERTLALELESDPGRVGRFGDGVFVGSVRMGVGLDLDLVVVLGLAEGSFPASAREDSLLPDDDRSAAGGDLALRRDYVDREHRELLASLAAANQQVLCVPRGDLRRSSRRVPSRWVLDVASTLAETRWWSEDFLRAPECPWLIHVASFDGALRRHPVPATAQEHRLRVLLVDAHGLAADDVLRSGREVVEARRSNDFTRFDGNLAGLAVPSPAVGVTSPTRLEAWATCPFGYLLSHILNAQQVENPEEELQISPMNKGSLMHGALENFIVEILARPLEQQPDYAAPWPAADRARLNMLGEKWCADYETRGLTGRTIFWHRDRSLILRDLQTLLDEDDQHRSLHRTRPIAAELAFGFKWSPLAAVPIVLPDGRSVAFRGRADRVDIGDDGTIYVVDYKTGSSAKFDKVSKDDPDQAGTKLQLPVYAVAARLHQALPDAPVMAEYWFVTDKGKFKRVGYRVTAEVLDRIGTTLARMVHGIEAGVFPNHPAASSTMIWVECHPCEPDALGVVELRRAWERKRQDPALALYADLAEPLDIEPAEVEVMDHA